MTIPLDAFFEIDPFGTAAYLLEGFEGIVTVWFVEANFAAET